MLQIQPETSKASNETDLMMEDDLDSTLNMNHVIQLPPELDLALAGIFDTTDPLDASDFDAVEYVNMIFPNEQSLGAVDKVLLQLKQKIRTMDLEIRELIRTQTDAGAQTLAELENAKKSIQELFDKVQAIKDKSQSAESMVQDITKDIKSLDYAKKHLTISLSMLRRLQMLVTAVAQLRFFTSKKQYKDIALLLSAISQLVAYFQPYRVTIRPVAELCDQIHLNQLDLTRQIFAEFDAGFNVQGGLKGSPETLNYACMIAEVLDADLNVKSALVHWYIDLQLREYRTIFKDNPDFSGLDQVGRRFAWFRNIMKTYDEEHCAIFPVNWNMPERLSEKFCQDTKRDLENVLKNLGDAVDVKLMLQALQLTLEFENKLARRFGTSTAKYSQHSKNLSDDGPISPRTHTNATATDSNNKFYRVMASAFEPYLIHYINNEDKKLSENFDSYRSKTPLEDLDENVLVMHSSTDLFFFYRQTLNQFSRFTNGKSLIELCKLFNKWLKSYGELLMNKCPKDDKKPFNDDEIATVVLIVNTADYCYETTAQLEEKMKEKIEKESKDKIVLDDAKDVFLNVVTSCIKMFVKSFDVGTDPFFTTMTKGNWASVTAVGDQSEYITQVGKLVIHTTDLVKKKLRPESGKYYKTLSEKVADLLLNKFLNCVFRCKPISEIGAEQLLLDIHALRTVLMHAASTGEDNSVPPPPIFIKLLNKQVSRTERLLKMVLAPIELADGFVANYLHMFSDDVSLATFHKVLDLKGVKRSDFTALTELYTSKVPKSTTQNNESTQSNAASSQSTKTGMSLGFEMPKMGRGTDSLKVEVAGEKLKKMMAGLNLKKTAS